MVKEVTELDEIWEAFLSLLSSPGSDPSSLLDLCRNHCKRLLDVRGHPVVTRD